MSFDDSQNNVIYSENGSYKVTAYGEVVFGNDKTQYPLSDGVIEVGNDGRPTDPVLVLSSRGGHKIGAIQNVRSINVTHPLSEVAELSFDVYKEINGESYKDWDKIKDFKFIQMPHDNNWFEAKVTIDEENDIVKHVTCVHANEAELGQLNLYEVEINTDADIERDDYVETFFYNEENPKASLLHRILKDKAPHYQIYHVDDSLKGLWRSFSFNGVSIQDALNQVAEEVGCLFVYGEWSENDGKYHRTISAYDLEDYCYHCGKRGNYTEHVCTNCGSDNIKYGYGEDTGIFISRENLATSINYESNTDDVKNCFRLVAGDDAMTAAIKSCNPSMSQYMWYFSEDMLEDMSDELREKIIAYQRLVNDYQTTAPINIDKSYIDAYNSLVDKYSSYNDELVKIDYPINGTSELTEAYYNAINLYGFIKSELMPSSEKVESTTAIEQLEILQADGNMSEVGISSVSGTIPYTSANSAIQSYAKVYIDTSRYKVTVFTNDIVGTEWTGTITIQSYTDDEDTASDTFTITLFDSTDNTKYTDWVHQSVQKAMANREVTDLSVTNLFKKDESVESFKEKIKSYSLDYLDIMNDMATSAITIMTEQGIANEDSLDTDVYTQLYKPYLDKSRAIQAEIGIKEEELSKLQRPVDEDGNTDPRYPELGLIDVIVSKQNELSKLLDIQTYLGDDLWTELSFYRRENEYQNANYISDGLTDSEIIEQAQRFIESATKEIIKSATLQHSISAPLIDFLIMPEFMKLQKKFKTGNWIRLKVDDKVYKLRLTNWTVDFDNIEDLDVEFSDVVRTGGSVSDIASILSKSRSMATTYDYTAKQANKGKDANDTIKVYKDYGLDFRKIKAITSKGNTNIVYDDDGILLKRVDGTETLPEQARIYNNGIYITKDAWETVSTGLGHYSYVDPETGETVQTYGIIADTVIGKLILGENLKIYSQSGKFEMGDDGLVITAKPNDDNSGLFTIQKDTGEFDEDDEPIIEKYIYVDEDGHVNISGNSVIVRGATDSDTYSLDDARKVATNYLSADSSGIMIADLSDGSQAPSTATGRNVFINNTSVKVRDGQDVLASYGETTTIGKESGKHVKIDQYGVDIKDGDDSLASYGETVRIGQETLPHLELGSGGMIAYKNKTDKYYEIGDGSSDAVQRYIVPELPLILNLSHPVESVTSVSIDDTVLNADQYEWASDDQEITILDRPVGAIKIDVTYTYATSEEGEETSEGDEQTVVSTSDTFNIDAAPSLEIEMDYRIVTDGNVTVSQVLIDDVVLTTDKYVIDTTVLEITERPASSSTVTIQYHFKKQSPYFTFNKRKSGVDKGNSSASFGNESSASGDSSFATGIETSASGHGSFVGGNKSVASGAFSGAIGEGTTASGIGSFACGRYNVKSNAHLLSVGNGTEQSPSDAFYVSTDGTAKLYGDFQVRKRSLLRGQLRGGITGGGFVPMFSTKALVKTVGTVSANSRRTSLTVTATRNGYLPMAVSGIRILNKSGGSNASRCNIYNYKIVNNATESHITFSIANLGDADATLVKVEFTVFYITKNAVLGGE